MSLGDSDEKGSDVRIIIVSPQAIAFTEFPGEVLLEDNMLLVSVGEEASLLATAVELGEDDTVEEELTSLKQERELLATRVKKQG